MEMKKIKAFLEVYGAATENFGPEKKIASPENTKTYWRPTSVWANSGTIKGVEIDTDGFHSFCFNLLSFPEHQTNDTANSCC